MQAKSKIEVMPEIEWIEARRISVMIENGIAERSIRVGSTIAIRSSAGLRERFVINRIHGGFAYMGKIDDYKVIQGYDI